MKLKFLLSFPAAVLAALLCTTATPSSAQTILNTAGNFVLLAGTSITVASPGPDTFSNGNVGAQTAISGIPGFGTIVNGVKILGGSVVSTALTDLGNAKTALNAMPVTTDFTATPTLGGRTLLPGVYKFNVAADLTGILTLDAGGKNNVTWVINIGTSLTTAANAKVLFVNLGTNGGSDNGLFWNAGAGITFGATNVIAGNYLAGTSATFGTTIAGTGGGSGRAQALTGAISFDGPATMDILGGPGAGDMTGGLAFNGLTLTSSGYVLLSSTGTYTQGISSVVLTPGTIYNTSGLTIDGNSTTKTGSASATLLVFGTSATLSGTNAYAGGTIVDGGQLITGSANLPTNGAVTLTNSNGTAVVSSLVFNQISNGSFSGAITGSGSVTKLGAGSALTLSGANAYTGGTVISSGTLIASSANLPAGGSVSNSGALTFNQTADGSFSGVISGLGSVAKLGAVTTLTLAGANTYTGGTTVTAGTLALGANDRLANTGALTVNGGTFAVSSFSDTVGAVSLVSGTLSGTTGVLTGSSYDVQSGSVSAILGGAAALTKSTVGTVTLSGANTYTGGTTISAGTLVASSTSLPTNGNVTDSGTLVFDQAANGTFGGVISGAGSLTKQNTGTLTLSGANTYTGGTTILGGSLITSTTTLPTNGNVSNSGALTFNQTVNGTYGGAVTGSGSVTKLGAGTTLTLSGANAYTGGTVISAGTMVANSATLPTNGNVSNSGALILNQTADGTFGGVVTGTGSLTKLGAGTTLTLSGANAYTGGTTVGAGTLVVSSATLPASQSVAIATGSTLAFNQPVDGTFSGAITGSGSVTVQGAGRLTLTGPSTAAFNLMAGSLLLSSGGTYGTMTVSTGAFLGGNGTITGNLFNNGTLSPGLSPGTIIIAGNFSQGPAGTLVMEFASPTAFDQLVISGTASLAGTLQLDLLGGYDPTGRTYPIITAAGGVTGTFSPITGSAALAATVTYGANTVTVSFTQLPFGSIPGAPVLTPNQIAVANAAQASPALTAAVNAVPLATQLPAAFNALSPQGYEIWSDIAVAHATSLADRMQRAPDATPGHDSLYFDAGQLHARARGDLDVARSTFTTTGGVVGADRAFGPELSAGFFFDYDESVADLGRPGSSTSVRDFTLGARANWTHNDLFAAGVLALGFDDYNSFRPITFPGTAATARGNTNGREWLLGVSGGRHFTYDTVTLTPFASLLASGWESDGFTETGAGAFNATLAGQSSRSLRSELGLEGVMNWTIGSMLLHPHFRGAWLHEFANDARSMNAAFGPVAYTLNTRRPQRNSALLGVGLDLAITPRAVLYTEITAQTGGITRVLGEWRVGLSVKF